MGNDVKKISTSIQYQLTNVKIFDDVFLDSKHFNDLINQGPKAMKKYFLQEWNELKQKLANDEKLIIKDLNKNVTIDDFDATHSKTKNGTDVFFYSFPDYEYLDATSKYVALALTKNFPRYFTLEYSKSHSFDNSTQKIVEKPSWVVGEFFIDNSRKAHKNYGQIDNDRLSYFAGFILGILEAQNQ